MQQGQLLNSITQMLGKGLSSMGQSERAARRGGAGRGLRRCLVVLGRLRSTAALRSRGFEEALGNRDTGQKASSG